MNVVEEIKRINQKELDLDIPYDASWHAEYRNSAYIFIGKLFDESIIFSHEKYVTPPEYFLIFD